MFEGQLLISQADLYLLEAGLIFSIAEIGVILFILWKTPALQFLFPMRGILLNPMPNRFAEFKRIKKQIGRIAITKDNRVYLTRPIDFFVERKSKAPMAVVFADSALTTNPREAAMAEALDEKAIHNFDDLFDSEEHEEKVTENGEEKTIKVVTKKVKHGDIKLRRADRLKDRVKE